jgi:hypothetical protein
VGHFDPLFSFLRCSLFGCGCSLFLVLVPFPFLWHPHPKTCTRTTRTRTRTRTRSAAAPPPAPPGAAPPPPRPAPSPQPQPQPPSSQQPVQLPSQQPAARQCSCPVAVRLRRHPPATSNKEAKAKRWALLRAAAAAAATAGNNRQQATWCLRQQQQATGPDRALALALALSVCPSLYCCTELTACPPSPDDRRPTTDEPMANGVELRRARQGTACPPRGPATEAPLSGPWGEIGGCPLLPPPRGHHVRPTSCAITQAKSGDIGSF